jgi:hypothetical protein
MVAPAKPGILKIASAAGLVIDPANSRRITPDACERCIDMARATGQAARCGECASRFDCAYQHIGAVRTDTGWRIVKASYEWNLDAQRRKLVREAKKRLEKAQADQRPFDAEEHVEDRLDAIISERYGLAETKSLLRLVRAICHLRQAYSREEMLRPFIVVRTELAPDLDDPAVRQALAQKAIASSAEIFPGAREVGPIVAHDLHAAHPAELAEALVLAPDFSEAEERAEPAAELDEDDGLGGVPVLVPVVQEPEEPVLSPVLEEAAPVAAEEPAPSPGITAGQVAEARRAVRAARRAKPVTPAPKADAEPAPAAPPVRDPEAPPCDGCGKPLTPNVLAYCQSPRGRATFGGANFCYVCQRTHRAPAGEAVSR